MKPAYFLSTRPPTLSGSSIQICLRCKLRLNNAQTRRISSSSVRKGIMPQMGSMPNIASHIPKQKSANAQMKEMGAGRLPNDLGFLPFTMVRPPGRDLPGWISRRIKDRFRIEWFRIQQSTSGLIQLFSTLKYSNRKDPITGKKVKSPSLQLALRTQIAQSLHKRLYTAIAAGDMPTLRKVACDGLVQKQGIRIDQRRHSGMVAEKWKLEKYYGFNYPSWLGWPLLSWLPNASAKVLVDKVIPLPVRKDSYLRQIVVRIRSLQSLDKGDGKGAQEKVMMEYVVIQKTKIGEAEKDWMVWGTVEPNNEQEIEDIIKSAKMEGNVGVMDRFKSMAPGFMGGT